MRRAGTLLLGVLALFPFFQRIHAAPAPDPDDLEEVRLILRELSIQSSPLAKGESGTIRAEDMPRFSLRVLGEYSRDSNKSEFRDAVIRARDLFGTQIAALPL